MPELVALDMPGGQGFVDALRAAWDAGDAVAPLDPRLPPAAARVLLDAVAPTVILDRQGTRTRWPGGRPVEDGDALVMATSGSTGRPRGVVLTHAAVRASARATSARLEIDPARHAWLACLPLAHIGGLSVLTRSLVTGTPCTVVPGFDAESVEQFGRDRRATHVSLVATALGRITPAYFERILLGGAAPPGEVAANVVATYGLTETGSGVVYDGVPLDGVSVAVGDGRPGQGAPGELVIRGPMLLRAYRDGFDPRILGPDGSGDWFPTGDGGRVGSDGTVSVDGRLAEVIVTGAEKVWPVEVERLVAAAPGVAEAAVWKRPDPEWGERVVAWVVPVDPAAPPSLEQLRSVVGEQLAPWAAPKELVIVTRLPRTASGKVRRADLH